MTKFSRSSSRLVIKGVASLITAGAAFLVLSYPEWFGLSVNSAVVGFFVLMILAVAISSIGARWVQAARPVAADSAVAKAERKKLLSRSRRTMALLFAVLLAIIFPFIPLLYFVIMLLYDYSNILL